MTPVPVTVIGGFLGAGKTTLVNHLLRQSGGQRIAVLVNDFGDLPIDDALIEAREGNLLRLAGGCVCCSFGSDLLDALRQLRNLLPAPQHVLLECSGVALPAAVARTLTLLPGLPLDAVLVLADAETVRERAADRYVGELVLQQLAEADLIVLNKCDLVDPAALSELQSWLAQRAPRARQLSCSHGGLDPTLLLDIGRAGSRASGHLGGPALRAPPAADTLFDSLSLEFDHAVDPARLATALADPSLPLLRAKGLLRDAAGHWSALQLVGRRSTIGPLAHPPALPRLVCIAARGALDAPSIRALLAHCAV